MVTALNPTTDAGSGLPLVRRSKGVWDKPRRPIGETDLLVPSVSSLLPVPGFVGDGNRMRHDYPAWAATRARVALVAPRRHFRRALSGSQIVFPWWKSRLSIHGGRIRSEEPCSNSCRAGGSGLPTKGPARGGGPQSVN